MGNAKGPFTENAKGPKTPKKWVVNANREAQNPKSEGQEKNHLWTHVVRKPKRKGQEKPKAKNVLEQDKRETRKNPDGQSKGDPSAE